MEHRRHRPSRGHNYAGTKWVQAVGIEPTTCAPYVLQLLGVRASAAELAALSPQAHKARTFAALWQICLRNSRQHALIIEVENLPRGDSTSEEWLMFLAERLAGVRILLLVSYRSGYYPPWSDRSYATQVALPRLPPADT